jgi:hypothetical protein
MMAKVKGEAVKMFERKKEQKENTRGTSSGDDGWVCKKELLL